MQENEMPASPIVFENIATLMKQLHLPGPLHPLITLVHYDQDQPDLSAAGSQYLLHFYKIAFKSRFHGKAKYGPGSYDFREGGLAFVGPHQLVGLSSDPAEQEGYALFFHPDLLHGHPLGAGIHRYGFFSYAISEALYLSEREKQIVTGIFEAIRTELHTNMDAFSRDVLLSQLELLLNHCNRFYNRQFLTRAPAHHELIDRMNVYLSERIGSQDALVKGLPTTSEVAGQLKVSQRYLSDMLKSLTGKTTREHIHLRLIEQAKEMLAADLSTTAGVAFMLGFEHPQSFNKFFRQKTGRSPSAFQKALRARDCSASPE